MCDAPPSHASLRGRKAPLSPVTHWLSLCAAWFTAAWSPRSSSSSSDGTPRYRRRYVVRCSTGLHRVHPFPVSPFRSGSCTGWTTGWCCRLPTNAFRNSAPEQSVPTTRAQATLPSGISRTGSTQRSPRLLVRCRWGMALPPGGRALLLPGVTRQRRSPPVPFARQGDLTARRHFRAVRWPGMAPWSFPVAPDLRCWNHSYRSASIGSMRDALTAG